MEVATEAASDDIRSALAAAMADSEKEPETVVAEKPAKAEAAPEPEGDKAPSRGPDGKFAKKEEAEEPVEAVAEETPAEEPAEEVKEEPKGIEAPANWKAEDKETFKKLPAEAQKILLDRQKGMDAD